MASNTPPPAKSIHENLLDPVELLRIGAAHEIEDLVKLELTAEQMLENEAALLGAYIAEDKDRVRSFWHEFTDEVVLLELELGQWLLSAADPSRVEWQKHHWWEGDDPNRLH